MNLKDLMAACLKKQREILDAAKKDGRSFTADEKTSFDALDAEFKGLKARFDAEELAASNAAYLNTPDPVNSVTPERIEVKPQPLAKMKLFKNLNEQLMAVKAAANGNVDERLKTLNVATGASTGVGEDGGFAIQQDYAADMMDSAVAEDPLLSMVDTFQLSGRSNRVSWNELKETSIASTVFGGIQTYWASEAGTVAASKPAMQKRELSLEKLMGFYYNTDEMEQDSSFNSQVATRGFTASIRRNLAAAIVSGDGIGKPLGILSAGCLVSVAKEVGQSADTIVWENISKMYQRARGNKSAYAWLVHPDVPQQLENMVKIVGTGGVPVYLPAALAGSVDTLRGRPILESDQCSALGDKGDIFLIDPKQYLLIYKGGIEQAVSIHVSFLTAENCFRFIFRVNGMPKQSSALTIKNSSATRSSIVTLDARA